MAKQSAAKAGASAPADGNEIKPSGAQVVSLTRDRQHELLTIASRTGADEDSIDDLKRELRSETLTAGRLGEIERKLDEMTVARRKLCRTYWVRENCRVRFHATTYGPGDKMRLTPEEAEDMADVVHDKAPPPPPPPIDKRVAGQYRVKGPGAVKFARSFHRPGTVLELDAEQAKSLGDAVEYVHPEPAE